MRLDLIRRHYHNRKLLLFFNTKTKRFEECNDYDKAKQLFISAPEGWYVVLKNPTPDGQPPQAGRPNQSPSNMEIGKKVNIFGPVSFALHPGQMAKVIQGHRLRSNQYLLARVYDADAANKNEGVVTDVDGKDQKTSNKYFPGNYDVLAYNEGLNEKSLERGMKKGTISDPMKSIVASAFTDAASMDCLESNAGISRGTSYTKPRTITLDNKYDGVVTIDVWTGYAINVVSKSGKREVVVGPTTKLLDYDETLEVLELSTGRPKTTDNLIKTAYLRVDNNKISDLIKVQTKDFVDVQIKVSYCVDFLEDYKDKWFSVENYVKYMCDRERSLLKREAKKYTIEEFYANASDIVRNICLNLPAEDEDRESECGRTGRLFKENGMLVHDVEVLSIAVDSDVARILESHQEEMIRKCLDLSDATKKMEIVTKLAEYEKKENELKHQNQIYKIELDKKSRVRKTCKRRRTQ